MINAIITDIEGTTSSIAFVKDVLFPYAREHLPAYIRSHAGEPAVAANPDPRGSAHDPCRAFSGIQTYRSQRLSP